MRNMREAREDQAVRPAVLPSALRCDLRGSNPSVSMSAESSRLAERWISEQEARLKAQSECERLRAALQGLLPLLVMIEDEPETDAEILRAIWEARVALDPALVSDKE